MNYTRSTAIAAEAPSSRAQGARTAEHTALGRLAGWCYDHRRRVLLVWIAAIIVITVLAQTMGSRFQDSFGSGNSASQQVQNLLAARFPQTAGTSADVVIATTGSIESVANRSTTDTLVRQLSTLPHVSVVRSPYNPVAHQISSNRRIAFAVVQFNEDVSTVPTAPATASPWAGAPSPMSSPPPPGPVKGPGSSGPCSSCSSPSAPWWPWVFRS
jgi:hypothetical protein